MRGGGEQIKEKRKDEDLQAGGWKGPGTEQAGGEAAHWPERDISAPPLNFLTALLLPQNFYF